MENILQNGSTWVSIDPKGIIGEMAFDTAAFDLLSPNEIKNNQNISALIEDRISLLAKILDLNFNRLLAWFFIRIIMSAQWFIEDKGNPSFKLKLANYVYPGIQKLNCENSNW